MRHMSKQVSVLGTVVAITRRRYFQTTGKFSGVIGKWKQKVMVNLG